MQAADEACSQELAALRAVLTEQEALTRAALAALAHAHSQAASAQQARSRCSRIRNSNRPRFLHLHQSPFNSLQDVRLTSAGMQAVGEAKAAAEDHAARAARLGAAARRAAAQAAHALSEAQVTWGVAHLHAAVQIDSSIYLWAEAGYEVRSLVENS